MKYSDTLTAITEALPDKFDLSPREREVFKLIIEGCSNPEIAAYLNVSMSYANSTVNDIVSKKMLMSGGRHALFRFLLEELDHEVMNAEKRIYAKLEQRSVAQ